MGNGSTAEETSNQLHESFLSQQYKVVSEKEDQAYGRINFIQFPNSQNPNALYIHKVISTKATDNPQEDEQNFEQKTRIAIPGVTSIVFCAPAPGQTSKYNIVFQYSPDSLESKLARRSLNEEEVWKLYDFLVQIGVHFESNRDHYYEICPRDILYMDRKMLLCSQYIYDKYTTGILRYFSGKPSYDNDKLHQKVLRHNIKRLGNFLIEVAIRRPTKINTKNEAEIREEALKMSNSFSQKLSLYAMQLALNKENWVFSDLRPSNAVSTPTLTFFKPVGSQDSDSKVANRLGGRDDSYSVSDKHKPSAGGFMLPKMASVNKENQDSGPKTPPKDYYSTQNGYPNVSSSAFESRLQLKQVKSGRKVSLPWPSEMKWLRKDSNLVEER